MGIWEKWIKGKKEVCRAVLKNNKGLTFVELVCAVAIFGVIGTAVGGVMVVSANSYQRGTNEIELQQEAQLTANQIADIVIDTTSDVIYTDAGTQKTLDIRKADRQYQITYKAAECQIVYSEYMTGADGAISPVAENQLLAEDVSGFDADVTDFINSGNARIFLAFERNGKTYESWYTITARNGLVDSNIEETASIVTVSEITLEPNEEYRLDAEVLGTVSDKTVHWSGPAGNTSSNTIVYTSGGSWYIKVGADESAAEITLTVETNAKKEGTADAMAWQPVTVKIRRVNAMNVNGWLVSGIDLKKDAVYKINAAAAGTHLSRVLGVEYDSIENYKNPYFADFSCEFTVAGETKNLSDYVEIMSVQEDVNAPYIAIRLKQDMPSDSRLVVTVTAKHPQGIIGGSTYNKTALPYGDVKAEYILENTAEGPHEIIEGGLQRGSVTSKVGFNGDLTALKNAYGGVDIRHYWRYRTPGGEWSEWLMLSDHGGTDFHINGASDLDRLAPDQNYELQVKSCVVNSAGNAVWPVADTPESEYLSTFQVSRTYVCFKEDPVGFTENCYSAGTQTNPIVLQRSHGGYYFAYSQVVGANDNYINQHLKLKGQKLIDGIWQDVSLEGNVTGWNMYINFQNGSEGLYRVELKWDNPAYHYNDGTTDIGIFYFKVIQ